MKPKVAAIPYLMWSLRKIEGEIAICFTLEVAVFLTKSFCANKFFFSLIIAGENSLNFLLKKSLHCTPMFLRWNSSQRRKYSKQSFNNHYEKFPMRFIGNRKTSHTVRMFKSFRGSAPKKNPSFSAVWTSSSNGSSVQLISKPRKVYICTFTKSNTACGM